MTRDRLIALLILLLLAVLAAIGCVVYRAQMARVLGSIGTWRVHADMTPSRSSQRPAGLSLRYEWNAGAMPPPHHYEYVITIGPGGVGEIAFSPDYPGEGVPVWREAFAIAEKDLDRLYGLMMEAGVFGARWAPMRDRPVGGDIEWMDVTAHGDTVRIPALAEGSVALEPIYDAIHGLVPDETWNSLRDRRQAYEETYQG